LFSGNIDFHAMHVLSSSLKHSELTDQVIGVFYDVFNELGHGFLESTYAEAMVIALEAAGMNVARNVPIPVWFRGKTVGQWFADLLVEKRVLIEIRAAKTIESGQEAQILHYLRATEIEVGLLLNFGVNPRFRRVLFDNERKKFRGNAREPVSKVPA
jgi:GxxExxY protein